MESFIICKIIGAESPDNVEYLTPENQKFDPGVIDDAKVFRSAF
jgi:hypothetical protein